MNRFLVLLLVVLSINTTAQVMNAGIGGNNTVNLLERLDYDVLEKEPDLVVLMVGTNDLLNSKKMISYELYEKNLKEIISKIKSAGIEIVLMSSPPVDSIYLFERHDRNLFTESPNVKLETARNIVSMIAEENELKFLDLFQTFKEMNLPKHNEDLFFRNPKNSGKKDGVHPTTLGYQFMGETVFYFLKENGMLTENQKIICFGDSITRGDNIVENGKSYPEILRNKIEAFKE